MIVFILFNLNDGALMGAYSSRERATVAARKYGIPFGEYEIRDTEVDHLYLAEEPVQPMGFLTSSSMDPTEAKDHEEWVKEVARGPKKPR